MTGRRSGANGLPPDPESIYDPAAARAGGDSVASVVSPFHLHTDPMAGFLLANFEGDPDRIYPGLDPQVFDDPIHGRGLLVIGWRVDGRVDVFHDPELRLDPATYGIAGKGLHTMVERSFADARFELGSTGAQVDLAFDDLEGRPVRLFIRETGTRPRRPFGLLAPMGSAATDPPALPLVFGHDSYFVRRAGSEVRIEIDGTLMAESRGVHYTLEANGAFLEIRRMSRREGPHEAVVEFTPAFPDLLALRDRVEVTGAFRISADPGVGTVTGRWSVRRQDHEIHMEAIPEGGWIPGKAPPMARLIFRMVSVFRTWPRTYRWRGTLELPPPGSELDGPLPFHAGWERIG